MICPYCEIKPTLKGRKTCGDPVCQHKRKIENNRGYFNTYLRKTPRKNRSKQKEAL